MEKFAAEVSLRSGRTGSFEITVDGNLAFSKLALGRFPEDDEINAITPALAAD